MTAAFDGTLEQLRHGIELETGTRHKLKIHHYTLKVRLFIDPNDAESWDDKFILVATHNGKKYHQTKTVKDDLVPGDECVDLEYEFMIEGATYTLLIDPGDEGEPYNHFADVPFSELFPQAG